MEISLNKVGKKYSGHWIFRDISATFSAGNVYPIVGQNGSGKSTLLQLISGFITPNEGTVKYTQSEPIDINDWYRHIAISAPYFDLFEEFTVKQSLELHEKLKPLKKASSSIVKEIQLLEHQDKPLSQLSSGMKQRLKLALALYTDAEILLLDEPCSNLDQQWMLWYNKVLSEQRNGRVVVIASNEHSEELKLANQEPIKLVG